MLSHLSVYWDTPFAVELLLLALTAPVLYFPGRFPTIAIPVAIALLVAGWFWRRWHVGVWFRRTPADWPLFFLFLVMLPISIWAAPEPLREQYSIPRGLILIWNFFLFWVIASHGSRNRTLWNLSVVIFGGSGIAIALIAPFGADWVAKLPVVGALVVKIPTPLAGMFLGAESGFNLNQLAGTMLYVTPLMVAWTIYGFSERPVQKAIFLFGGIASAITGVVLLLSQSRTGIIGLLVGLGLFFLILRRQQRWIAVGILLVFAIPFFPILEILGMGETTSTQLGNQYLSLKGRPEIWSQGFLALSDFSMTGIGLGTFRKIAPTLYPSLTVPASFDIAHAHNFFLQTGLDLGIPGLIALISILVIGAAQFFIRLQNESPVRRIWIAGMASALTAQIVYGMFDSVSMGSKTNFLFWFQIALLLSLSNILTAGEGSGQHGR